MFLGFFAFPISFGILFLHILEKYPKESMQW